MVEIPSTPCLTHPADGPWAFSDLVQMVTLKAVTMSFGIDSGLPPPNRENLANGAPETTDHLGDFQMAADHFHFSDGPSPFVKDSIWQKKHYDYRVR